MPAFVIKADRAGVIIVRCLLAIFALSPVIWFTAGIPVKSVDSFFSLHPSGRLGEGLFAWSASDSVGTITSSLPASGLNELQGLLFNAGLPVYALQALILVAIAFFALTGMYAFTRRILEAVRPGSSWNRLAAAAAAIAWLCNPFALGFVWFHQMLIEVTWAVVPWLLFTEFVAITGEMRTRYWAPLLVIVATVGSAGLPHADLPGIALIMLSLAAGLSVQAHSAARLKRAALFFAVTAVALSWWLLPSIPVLHQYVAQARVSSTDAEAQLQFASLYSSLARVITLTAIPVLYQSVDGFNYMTWSPLFTSAAGLVLRWALPITAIAGVYFLVRARAVLLAVALAVPLVLSALISKGVNAPLPGLNRLLLHLPLGDAFRHPVDKFAVPLIASMVVLFGVGISGLLNSKRTRIIGAVLAGIVCVWLGQPWFTGSVIARGGGMLPSVYADMPPDYDAVGDLLKNAPAGGKTFSLPFSPDGKTAYVWPEGVQPNLDCLLQDWAPNRTFLCHNSGDALADIPGTVIANAIVQRDPRVFKLAQIWGFDRWLVHKDWRDDYAPVATDAISAAGFLNNPQSMPYIRLLHHRKESFALDPAHPALGLLLSANRNFRGSETIAALGDLRLKVASAVEPQHVYIGLQDLDTGRWYTSQSFRSDGWQMVVLTFTTGGASSLASIAVNGISQGRVFECGAPLYHCSPTDESMRVDSVPLHGRLFLRPGLNLSQPVLGRADGGRFLYALGPDDGQSRPRFGTGSPMLVFFVANKPAGKPGDIFRAGNIYARTVRHGGPTQLLVSNSENGVTRSFVLPKRRSRVELFLQRSSLSVAVDDRIVDPGYDLCEAPAVTCGLKGNAFVHFAKNASVSGAVSYSPPEPVPFKAALQPVHSSDVLALWASPALPLIYAAHADVVSESSAGGDLLSAAARVDLKSQPALTQTAAVDLDRKSKVTWDRLNPCAFDGTLDVHGNALMVFSETYGSGWQLVFRGPAPRSVQHIVVNGFANGWLIEGDGIYDFTMTYAPQRALSIGLTAGVSLAVLAICLLIPTGFLRFRKSTKPKLVDPTGDA